MVVDSPQRRWNAGAARCVRPIGCGSVDREGDRSAELMLFAGAVMDRPLALSCSTVPAVDGMARVLCY